MSSSPAKLAHYASGLLALRHNDVFLASFPRSGSTWIRFLLCNLISLRELEGKSVDFDLLNGTMLELGVSDLSAPWPHTTMPRVIKTHKRYCLTFRRAGATIGLVRDPRDVMVSFYHFKKDLKGSYKGSFSEFIRNRGYGLEAWIRHYNSWKPHWSLIVRYRDLKQDTYTQLERILSTLGVTYPGKILREAIDRSSFSNVGSVDETSENPPNARFARNGSTRQWPRYFSTEDLEYYRALAERFARGGSWWETMP